MAGKARARTTFSRHVRYPKDRAAFKACVQGKTDKLHGMGPQKNQQGFVQGIREGEDKQGQAACEVPERQSCVQGMHKWEDKQRQAA
eukprot:1152055-Pelagomonas_calceolata.AAC.5